MVIHTDATGKHNNILSLEKIMEKKNKTEGRPEAKLLRMDNVAIVVQDLDAAMEFFTELGLALEGRMILEGDFVDKTVGLRDVRSEIAMMRMPDGHGGIELTKYHTPSAINPDPKIAPPNMLGLHRVMFAVTNIDEMIERLRKHGAEVLDEVVQYENIYRLCYLRGPEGIILALAERIG